jgi:uncharacterized protein YbdZ (MbtH family)
MIHTNEYLSELIQALEIRVTKLEKQTSLFHETPSVPAGWCQICGMKKADCIHAEPI